MSIGERELFEQSYSESFNIPLRIIVEKREGDSYRDPILAGALRGWLIHEDAVSDQSLTLLKMTTLVKNFFNAYRAFGIYTSPVAKRREDEYQRDVRERMLSVYEEACALVKYDVRELDSLLDAENPVEPVEPVESIKTGHDAVAIRELPRWMYGETKFISGKKFKYGYTLITAQHWLTSIRGGEAGYTVHNNAATSEYVDVFIYSVDSKIKGTDKSRRLLQNHLAQIQQTLFCAPLKTIFDFTSNDIIVVRFMVEHGDFLSNMKVEN